MNKNQKGHLPFSVIFGMVLELDHSSILYWVFAVICLFIIVKFTKFFSDLLNFWVVVIFLSFLAIVLVHASIHLHYPNSLPREISSHSSLNLYYESEDRKSTRLNSSHSQQSRMPSSA